MSLLSTFRKHDYRSTLICKYKENPQTTFVFFLRLLLKTVMDNKDKIMSILHVGYFLLNTSQVLQATELCQECLILLNITATQEQVIEFVYPRIYAVLFQAYRLLNDHTSAINFGRKVLDFLCGCGLRAEEGKLTLQLAELYQLQSKYKEAKQLYNKAMSIMIETGDSKGEALCHGNLGTVYHSLGEYAKAEEYLNNALAIKRQLGNKEEEAACYGNLGSVSESLGEYGKAEEYQRKALAIRKEIGDREGEATCYGNLGTAYYSRGEYAKAEEYQSKELAIRKEIGDREGEATCYGNLEAVYYSRSEYAKAEEYQRKALAIRKEIGDKEGEASCYGDLGTVFLSVGEYAKAEEYLNNALAMKKEIGDRKDEATCYGNLGNVYYSLGEYAKAEEYLNNALAIQRQLGNKDEEAACYGNLGSVSESLGEYGKAEEYQRKALAIRKEIGDREGEATCYGNLGTAYYSRGEYAKAEEYQSKELAIRKEIGDREGEATCYGNLEAVYYSRSEYAKAEEYQRKALAIRKEIGDKKGEAACYGNLGCVSESLGQYGKAEEYQWKALAITKEIGDKEGEARCYGNLGTVYHNLGEYAKAEEYLNSALATHRQLGNKNGEAACYGNLGCVSESLGEYGKAEKYQMKALTIRKEIGDRKGEADCYGNLGTLLRSLGKHPKAKQYHEKALAMSKEINDISAEATWHLELAYDVFLEGNRGSQNEIFSNLFASISKCEKMRSFLGCNDQFKISLLHYRSRPYHFYTAMLCARGKDRDAVCVLELSRARALADLISVQHSAQHQLPVNPPSWADIERILKKESNCSCLYISYLDKWMFLWVLKGNKPIHFRKVDVNKCFVNKGLTRNADQVFSEESFRRLNILSAQEQCEDRSLSFLKANDSTREPAEEASLTVYRPVEEEEEENLELLPTLAERYKMIIAPVADVLDQPELVIVPDRVLYKVPFAALMDESGNYLSETYRIRIVPSLTTLGLMQDSPADYHSQTGALIVGDPDVRDVYYRGCFGELSRLPSAKEEAEMIGQLIGAEPLLRKQATKDAVLQKIHSVSLIHFAAHGDAERGEIALAPKSSIKPGTATEKDYLLTMADISRVQLRAKLVVLSCCHSAQGHVKAEGVVGIARAFLGSGARSVLVALWAIPDEATKKLMSRFYEHLVRGESASESLHQAMKWMRNNGYPDIRDWAPFMLIGDNVTFDFRK